MGSLGVGGEGGRRKEAGLRWQDIASSDQTGSQLEVRVRILGSRSTAISTFGIQFRRHLWPKLWEDSRINNYSKSFPFFSNYSFIPVIPKQDLVCSGNQAQVIRSAMRRRDTGALKTGHQQSR